MEDYFLRTYNEAPPEIFDVIPFELKEKNWELYAAISFCHNHPPAHPRDLHQKFAPTLGLLHPSFCLGGGDLLGQLPRGGHLSINDVCHFWSFQYNGYNFRLTTLWGLLVALNFVHF